MTRLILIVFVVVAVLTTAQGFSWGRVFNNDDSKNDMHEGEGGIMSKDSQQAHMRMMREEEAVVERPLPETTQDEREKRFRSTRTEEAAGEEQKLGGMDEAVRAEEKTVRKAVEATSGSGIGVEHKTERDDVQHDGVQKEVSEMKYGLGGADTVGERVEVIGVPREREHHITDGLADAIAGLMRVYNSLVRSDGREWESSVHPSVDSGSGVKVRREDINGTESRTEEESVRVAEDENEKKVSWAPLAALAGIVVVAGAAIMLVGLTQRERGGGPIYPPRGPAYV